MPIKDPERRRSRQAAWERARQHALKRLAKLHPAEYRALLDEERARERISDLGYNGRQKPGSPGVRVIHTSTAPEIVGHCETCNDVHSDCGDA